MELKWEIFKMVVEKSIGTSKFIIPKGLSKKVILIRLKGKVEGISEIAPISIPFSIDKIIKLVFEAFNYVDKEPATIFDIQSIIHKLQIKNTNRFIQSSIDISLYDYLGKLKKVPVFNLFNRNLRKRRFQTMFTIGIDSIENICKEVKKAQELGFNLLKLKTGDSNAIKAVRDVFPGKIIIDLNSDWELDQAIKNINTLEKYNIEMIESPLKCTTDLNQYRTLHNHVSVPICADGTLYKLRKDNYIYKVIEHLKGCFDVINIKVTQCGGFSESIRVINKAKEMGLKVMIGYGMQSLIGLTAAAHLASFADYIQLDGMLFATGCPYRGIDLEKGEIVLSDQPGLGLIKLNKEI